MVQNFFELSKCLIHLRHLSEPHCYSNPGYGPETMNTLFTLYYSMSQSFNRFGQQKRFRHLLLKEASTGKSANIWVLNSEPTTLTTTTRPYCLPLPRNTSFQDSVLEKSGTGLTCSAALGRGKKASSAMEAGDREEMDPVPASLGLEGWALRRPPSPPPQGSLHGLHSDAGETTRENEGDSIPLCRCLSAPLCVTCGIHYTCTNNRLRYLFHSRIKPQVPLVWFLDWHDATNCSPACSLVSMSIIGSSS